MTRQPVPATLHPMFTRRAGMSDCKRGVVAARIRRVVNDGVHLRGILCLVQMADQEPGEDHPPTRLAAVLETPHDLD